MTPSASLSLCSNPTPGVVINRPNGTDVYKGVPKDYTGDVSAAPSRHAGSNPPAPLF